MAADRAGQPGHPGCLHHPQAQPLQRTRIVTSPRQPGGDAPPGGQFPLLVESPLGEGVQRDTGVREMVLDAGQERGDLFFRQVGQHPVGHEEVRSRALRDDGQPFLAGHRRGHHPAAAGVGEELPPQLDGVGQVQVDPVHPAVVHPLEAAVQPGADLHYRARRVPGQEVADPGVHQRGPQHGHRPARAPAVLGIDLHRARDLHRFRVPQQGMAPLGRPGPGQQRDEQRLLHRPQPGLLPVRHARYYTASGVWPWRGCRALPLQPCFAVGQVTVTWVLAEDCFEGGDDLSRVCPGAAVAARHEDHAEVTCPAG